MINRAFLAALVDSLVPGGIVGGSVALPVASTVGCDRAIALAMIANTSLRILVDEIAARAGGPESFAASDTVSRVAGLETAQRLAPESFAGLVTAALAHYYAQPDVLEALGWPSRPPQPEGHQLPPFNADLLMPVKARGPIWRQC